MLFLFFCKYQTFYIIRVGPLPFLEKKYIYIISIFNCPWQIDSRGNRRHFLMRRDRGDVFECDYWPTYFAFDTFDDFRWFWRINTLVFGKASLWSKKDHWWRILVTVLQLHIHLKLFLNRKGFFGTHLYLLNFLLLAIIDLCAKIKD